MTRDTTLAVTAAFVGLTVLGGTSVTAAENQRTGPKWYRPDAVGDVRTTDDGGGHVSILEQAERHLDRNERKKKAGNPANAEFADLEDAKSDFLERLERVRTLLERAPQDAEYSDMTPREAADDFVERVETLVEVREAVLEAFDSAASSNVAIRRFLASEKRGFEELADSAEREAAGLGIDDPRGADTQHNISREAAAYRSLAASCDKLSVWWRDALTKQADSVALLRDSGLQLERMHEAGVRLQKLADVIEHAESIKKAIRAFDSRMYEVNEKLRHLADSVDSTVREIQGEVAPEKDADEKLEGTDNQRVS